MKISEIRISLPKTESEHLAAFVSVIIDDCFAVHGLKIIKGDKGLFVAMPSTKTTSGDFRDVCHPINKETREMINAAIIEAYEKAVAEAKETAE